MRPEASSDLANVTLAIGVLSAIGFERRREAVRDSWMRFRSPSVAVRFVVRCGGLPAHHTLRREAHVLCSPVPHTEGRLRGPILALLWWFEFASDCGAKFISKADDDVFVHIPDLLAMLQAIPQARAPQAYLGFHGFYSLIVRGGGGGHSGDGGRPGERVGSNRSAAEHYDHRYAAWADTHANAVAVQQAQGFKRTCRMPRTACYGPFPMACGPLLVIGRSVVQVTNMAYACAWPPCVSIYSLRIESRGGTSRS